MTRLTGSGRRQRVWSRLSALKLIHPVRPSPPTPRLAKKSRTTDPAIPAFRGRPRLPDIFHEKAPFNVRLREIRAATGQQPASFKNEPESNILLAHCLLLVFFKLVFVVCIICMCVYFWYNLADFFRSFWCRLMSVVVHSSGFFSGDFIIF